MSLTRHALILCCLAALPAFAQDAGVDGVPNADEGPWLAPPGAYALDPNATTVTMTANRFLLSPVRAAFGTVEGDLAVTAEAPSASALVVEIAAGDLSANGPIVENMLKGEAFLNAETHPTIAFTVDGFTVSDAPTALEGELAMAGVSHPARFDTRLESFEADLESGVLRLHFVSEGALDRRDWGMTGYRGVVSDTVRIRIEAEFVQSASGAVSSASAGVSASAPSD